MRRKTMKTIISMVLTVGILAGCQKTPDSSIVTNKDFDNMVDEANNAAGDAVGMNDIASDVEEKYSTYQTEFSDETLGVSVKADAKVDIPKTDKMSIIRVRQKDIDQEFLDKVIDKLVPGETLYDGCAMYVRTKADIEAEINYIKTQIRLAGEPGEYSGDSVEFLEEKLNEYEEEYENAPEKVNLNDYITDGTIVSVSDKYNDDPENDYYSWQHELNPDGKLFYGINDGARNNYITMYLQNSEDRGNLFRFRRSSHDYINTTSVVSAGNDSDYGRWDAENQTIEDGELLIDLTDYSSPQMVDGPVTISEEEAVNQANGLISELGLTGYSISDVGLYSELPRFYTEGELCYRDMYIVRYLRHIDGVAVDNDAGFKFKEDWTGDEHVKKEWPGESIEVCVNDDGIVGFDYLIPIEEVETVVESAGMRPFDEIKDIFEQMVLVKYATADDGPDVMINVDRVALRYTRISEADNFDTGLLVPVWDFIGSIKTGMPDTDKENANILTINAIDGSIIDRTLGY